jgi:hypothetical protein
VTTTHIRTREDRRALLSALVGLLTMIVTLALASSLAPASAETPAERCKRETTAYNNAWKNSWAASHPGKKPSDAPKPPVPYKCGGKNDGPPPTVQPTTTAPDAPSEDVEPSTETPREGSSGPEMNAPTKRRDLEHPERDQPTVGNGPRRTPARATLPSASTARKPASAPRASDRPTLDDRPRPTGSAVDRAPFDPMSVLNKYKYEAYGDTPPPSDPINDGCSYCSKDSVGRVQNGPANSPDGWINNWGCPDGTHGSGVLDVPRCFTDYDYYIENRRLVAMTPKSGEPPIGLCRRTDANEPSKCIQGMALSNEISQSASTTESAEGSAGAEARGVNVGGTLGTSKTTETGQASGIERSGSQEAPGDLKPGEEIAYYQVWELWTYDIVSERNGEYKRYPAYQWVPTAAVQERRGPIGSNLQW